MHTAVRYFSVLLLTFLVIMMPTSAQAIDLLEQFSDKDSRAGLSEALIQAAEKTVSELGRADGFWSNAEVRIGLPNKVAKVTDTLKKFGMGKYVNELELRMNRAAESAVPEAKALFVQSIKQMRVDDVKTILQGGSTSATDYFRKSTSAPLAEKFKPVIVKSIGKNKIAESYNKLAKKARTFGLISAKEANLEDHITQKTLDGLFKTMAKEEKALRENPTEVVGDVAKKIFDTLDNH